MINNEDPIWDIDFDVDGATPAGLRGASPGKPNNNEYSEKAVTFLKSSEDFLRSMSDCVGKIKEAKTIGQKDALLAFVTLLTQSFLGDLACLALARAAGFSGPEALKDRLEKFKRKEVKDLRPDSKDSPESAADFFRKRMKEGGE